MIDPKVISRKIKAFSESFKIVTTTYLFRKGNEEFEFDFYSMKSPNFVVGIAIKEGKILLVDQYRFPVEGMNTEFVCGRIDYGFTPYQAINNEMREEAGIVVKSTSLLGVVKPTAGRASNKGYIFLIDDFTESKPEREKFEELTGLKHYWVDLDKFDCMIKEGILNDGITLSAWALYLTMKGNK